MAAAVSSPGTCCCSRQATGSMPLRGDRWTTRFGRRPTPGSRRPLDRLNRAQLARPCGRAAAPGYAMHVRQAVSKHLGGLERASDLSPRSDAAGTKLHLTCNIAHRSTPSLHRWLGARTTGSGAAGASLDLTTALDRPPWRARPSSTPTLRRAPTRAATVGPVLTDTGVHPSLRRWSRAGFRLAGRVTVLWQDVPDGEPRDLGQRVLVAEPYRRLSYSWHGFQPEHAEHFGLVRRGAGRPAR